MTHLYFADWDSLINAVKGKTEKILKEDVSPVAEAILKKHIQTDIYDAYTPVNGGIFGGIKFETAYQRRENLSNSVYSFMDGDELVITSDEKANTPLFNGNWSLYYPGSFLEMLEKGNLGMWTRVKRKRFPRPAVSNAQTEINSSTRIHSAIKQGIKREIEI